MESKFAKADKTGKGFFTVFSDRKNQNGSQLIFLYLFFLIVFFDQAQSVITYSGDQWNDLTTMISQ